MIEAVSAVPLRFVRGQAHQVEFVRPEVPDLMKRLIRSPLSGELRNGAM
jgi:hypothetical protein